MNPKSGKAYKEFIVPHGKQVSIKINRKPTSFTIKRSFVFPESSGAVYLNSEEYGNDTIGVIDIGGLNANCCISKEIEKIFPWTDLSISDSYGDFVNAQGFLKVTQKRII